jgi:fimbrial isopeptide formation D2 family protein/LPXTG-motif cell wall-anchored protein
MMTLSTAVTALAAEDTKYTITAPDNGHTYEVYQIFTGTLSEGTLSNIKWGQNGTGYDANNTDKYVDSTITEELAGLTSNKTDAEKLAVITKYVDLDSEPFTKVESGKSEEVPAGYYLIKDIDNSQSSDAYTLYIVSVVGNTTITPKTGVPTVEKKVYDEEKGWQDASDYDIGDSIPYKLTATLSDISMYSTYYVQFDDVLCKGLTYNSDAKVYVVNGENKVEVTDSFTITSGTYSGDNSAYTEGSTLYVTCDDIKSIEDVTLKSGTQIVVEYSATLNTNAQIGATGNPNEVKLVYSNNPNANHDGEKGTTPDDKVTVFTYKLIANKVDGNNSPLKGAGFTLYKETTSEGKTDWAAVGSELTGNEMTTFTWSGLDSGKYKLVETTVPSGFNQADDIIFTVTATYDIESDDPQLTNLAVDNNSVTVKSDLSEMETTIVNYTGAVLPSTGGKGTVMFILGGAALLVCAGALLVTRKYTKAKGE